LHFVLSIINSSLCFLKQLHESQVAYLKLQAHTASLQSLKECYCRYAHMLDGARTMFNAYQQTTTRRDSIDQVKLGLKECTHVSLDFTLIFLVSKRTLIGKHQTGAHERNIYEKNGWKFINRTTASRVSLGTLSLVINKSLVDKRVDTSRRNKLSLLVNYQLH
jgi:hypothetical protein